MLNKKALSATAAAAVPAYVEEFFSTHVYTGTGATQSITNGLDLSGQGGLTWIKTRSAATGNRLYDTARGATIELVSDSTAAETTVATSLTSFNSNGFTIGADTDVNTNGAFYTSWSFRKKRKFFDVVTYTGTGVARTVSHNLGSVPGCIIVKQRDGVEAWYTYHRGVGAAPETDYLALNSTAQFQDSNLIWNDTAPTAGEFTVGTGNTNLSGKTYVAYLFAHAEPVFGENNDTDIIKCGSFTTTETGVATVTLDWEPQWVLIKAYTDAGGTDLNGWFIFDNVRGIVTGENDSVLRASSGGAETLTTDYINLTPTGFSTTGISSAIASFVYIAIRRGPMKTPTAGTEVFAPVAYTSTNVDNRLVDTGIFTDLVMTRPRAVVGAGTYGVLFADRLNGDNFVGSSLAAAAASDADTFMTPTLGYGYSLSAMNGYGVGNDATYDLNSGTQTVISWAFKRAPKFLDIVTYTGNGTARTINHNLGATPELMLVKRRSGAASLDWAVYANNDATDYLVLNTNAATADLNTYWNDTAPTSTVFSVGTSAFVNNNNATYVAYLFASLTGISKVGTYTGNGTSQTINCGFTAGARFVLIKRLNSTGDWVVFDTARGIVAGNDPYLLMNSTAVEVTDKDAVDTATSGFIVNETTGPNVNTNTGTYIYLAIA